MSGKITIDTERCKGCGLCVTVCPKNCIVISNRPNTIGYFPAEASPVRNSTKGPEGIYKNRQEKGKISNGASNIGCTGCAMCAIICPDAAIEVFGESDTVVKPSRKNKPTLIKKKA